MSPSTGPGVASVPPSSRKRLAGPFWISRLGFGLFLLALAWACSGKRETPAPLSKEPAPLSKEPAPLSKETTAPTKVVSKSPLVVTNADGSLFAPVKTFIGNGSGKAWEIPVGPVIVKGGRLTVHVGALPGYDSIYDYVRLQGADGKSVKVEAEDAATKGDNYSNADGTPGHWWLHTYDAFSKGQAVLVRKTQGTAPVLTTTVNVPDGTYQLFLGSFQGDSSGPFAIGVRWE